MKLIVIVIVVEQVGPLLIVIIVLTVMQSIALIVTLNHGYKQTVIALAHIIVMLIQLHSIVIVLVVVKQIFDEKDNR
jgi:hypothetical protein